MTRFRAAGALLLCLAVASSRVPKARWRNVTPHAEWEPGYSFTALGLRDTLWLFGHRKGTWYSAGGNRWSSAPPAGVGDYNAYVLHDDYVFAIGGAEDQNHPARHAVWKSADGRSWQLVTDAPAWSPRVWHTATVHDGRIWLLGGYDGKYLNDVWYSEDGASWHRATAAAEWAGRCMHASVSFDGKLWVLGGRRDMESWWETDFNDVWSSVDGVAWRRVSSGAGWSKRYGMATVAWNGRLWVMGGTRLFRSNEVWSSIDGERWVAGGAADWSPRFALASTVFRDRVWVLGGKESGGRFTNDVWYLDGIR